MVVDVHKPRVYVTGMLNGNPEAALLKAAQVLGGQAKLAATLGVTAQAVSKWRRGRVPAERVLEIERQTGVPRHDLRPDLYPRERAA